MKENFGKNLKQAMSQQMMNAKAFNVDAVEAMKSSNQFINSISEDELEDENQPETTEATSAGGAGQFSQPLFSTTKKKMEDDDSILDKFEAKEATSSASSGQYLTPAFVAKDSKNWRASKKTQIPGGKFVKIKDKCKKFPYCNQGDIKALKLWENETVKRVINKVSKRYGVSENVVKSIILHEYENKVIGGSNHKNLNK